MKTTEVEDALGTILGVVLFVLSYVVGVLILKWAWNVVGHGMFGLRELTYLQALAVVVIFGWLTGPLRRIGGK